MPKQHETELLAQRAKSELEKDAPRLAEGLFGGRPPGYVKLSRVEYVQMVREKWADAAYRQSLLDNMGPRNFLTLANEVLGAEQEPMMAETEWAGALE